MQPGLLQSSLINCHRGSPSPLQSEGVSDTEPPLQGAASRCTIRSLHQRCLSYMAWRCSFIKCAAIYSSLEHDTRITCSPFRRAFRSMRLMISCNILHVYAAAVSRNPCNIHTCFVIFRTKGTSPIWLLGHTVTQFVRYLIDQVPQVYCCLKTGPSTCIVHWQGRSPPV